MKKKDLKKRIIALVIAGVMLLSVVGSIILSIVAG